MLNIAGNGMGDYTFDNLKIDIDSYDTIICDKNFKEDGKKIKKYSYKEAKEYIINNYKREDILYVVTGSPLFFSAGTIIAKLIDKSYLKITNNTSSLEYIQSHFAISSIDIDAISIHGRSRIDLNRFLTNNYTLILCDKESIHRLQKATQYISKEKIESCIGYKLGYSDERIEAIDLRNFDNSKYDLTQPYVILIKQNFKPYRATSQDDEFITQRGMITKQYKRDLALQYLNLEPNLTLWDIGAGSGSCAIEAFKRYRVKTILFEKQPLRCDYIRQNLKEHNILDTILYEGEAQEIFDRVDTKVDRIFVGGGGVEVIAKLPYLYDRLEDGGILLMVAITLKNLTEMLSVLKNHHIEYEIISLSITTHKGKLDLIEPQREVFMIKINKGLE